MQGPITFVSAAVESQFVTNANKDATVQIFWTAVHEDWTADP